MKKDLSFVHERVWAQSKLGSVGKDPIIQRNNKNDNNVEFAANAYRSGGMWSEFVFVSRAITSCMVNTAYSKVGRSTSCKDQR